MTAALPPALADAAPLAQPPSSPSSLSSPDQRLHALDHLRAAMMWLGIVLHASIAYMAAQSPLPWHDDRSTPVADLLVAVIYAFGLCLHAQRRLLMARCERHWPVFAAMGLACFVVTGLLAEALAQPEASAFALVLVTGAFTDVLAAPVSATRHLQFWMALAYNAASWLWSFALIGAFLRYLSLPRAWLTYLANSSYWVYLVHLPMTVGFGALQYGVPLPPLAKIVINVLATTALCLASYHLCVRFTAVGLFLNGHRHPRPLTGEPAHAH